MRALSYIGAEKITFPPEPDWQTDGQNIYRIYSHLWGESAQKKAISQLGAEKITFPPEPDGQTYLQTNGRTFAFIE